MKDLFAYNNGEDVVPSTSFRISPSQLSRFFDDTTKWYREALLGEEGFTGSTATHLGTCVHAAAEYYTKHGNLPPDLADSYISSIRDPEVDRGLIMDQYPPMADALINGYLIHSTTKKVETEKFVWVELLDGIGVGGSIDRYEEDNRKIVDFKTMGSLDRARVPKKFPRAYWFQQLCYAWTLRKLGYKVETLELVYVSRENVGRVNDKGKPLKDYPSTVNVLSMEVLDDDLAIIESTLKLISHSVQAWRENPEIRYLLAQDWRLKVKPTPVLFNN